MTSERRSCTAQQTVHMEVHGPEHVVLLWATDLRPALCVPGQQVGGTSTTHILLLLHNDVHAMTEKVARPRKTEGWRTRILAMHMTITPDHIMCPLVCVCDWTLPVRLLLMQGNRRRPLERWCALRQASDCRIVLLVGLVVMVAPLAILCLFNDDLSLEERNDAVRCALRGCPKFIPKQHPH